MSGEETRSVSLGRWTLEAASARIAAVEAERDAAVARVAALEAAIGDARGLEIAADYHLRRRYEGEAGEVATALAERLLRIAAAAAPSTPAPTEETNR